MKFPNSPGQCGICWMDLDGLGLGGLEEGYTEIQIWRIGGYTKIQICFMHDRPAKMEDFQFDPQFNSFQGKYRTEVLSEPDAFIDPNV